VQKPVVVLKTGLHPAAQRAAASHTAALSTDAAVTFAALRQAGVHLVEDGLALLDVAASLDRQPPLRGRNVGIITNSGGTGVELTDLLEAKGLAVPALSPGLQAAIASVLPPHGSAVNPIDVTTDWQRFARMYKFSVQALMNSGEVDAVVAVLLQRSAFMPEVGEAIIAAYEGEAVAQAIHVCSSRGQPMQIAKNCLQPEYRVTLGPPPRPRSLPPRACTQLGPRGRHSQHQRPFPFFHRPTMLAG
jgi:acetyltransferase